MSSFLRLDALKESAAYRRLSPQERTEIVELYAKKVQVPGRAAELDGDHSELSTLELRSWLRQNSALLKASSFVEALRPSSSATTGPLPTDADSLVEPRDVDPFANDRAALRHALLDLMRMGGKTNDLVLGQLVRRGHTLAIPPKDAPSLESALSAALNGSEVDKQVLAEAWQARFRLQGELEAYGADVQAYAKTMSATPVADPTLPEKLKRVVDVVGAASRNLLGTLVLIDDILAGPSGLLKEAKPNENGTITRDPRKVNTPDDNAPGSARYTVAKEALAQLDEIKEAGLGALTPEQRAQYESVRRLLKDDPVAELALLRLLLSGRLPGDPDFVGGGTTLDNLARLADPNTPLTEGIRRGGLMADLVQELAVPSAIDQGTHNTCGATSTIIMLALKNPAEYVRLVTGLASPKGSVELANGDIIERDAELSGRLRSYTQALLAPALMEYAGPSDYQNDKDAHFRADGTRDHEGLYIKTELGHLLQGVFRANVELTAGGEDQERIWRTIQTTVGEGSYLVACLEWGRSADGTPKGHAVLVTGTAVVDGTEYVTYINPQGREERMSRADFFLRLYATLGMSSGAEVPAVPGTRH